MYHKILVIGNLTRDPEMRYTPNGQAVTNISLASNRKYQTSDGENVTEVTWFRITVWGKQAESCNQYLRKGSRVYVEGRLTPDPETGNPRVFTRTDGTPGSSYEISGVMVKFLSTRAEDEAQATDDDEEDFPF